MAKLLLLASGIFLVIGWFAPSISTSAKGDFARSVHVIMGKSHDSSLSLMAGVVELFKSNVWLGLLVGVFTFLFPLAKLGLLSLLLFKNFRGKALHRDRVEKAVELSGKWSMLDVMVLAVVVVSLKTLPGLEFQLQWGVMFFALSVLLSMGIMPCIRQAKALA